MMIMCSNYEFYFNDKICIENFNALVYISLCLALVANEKLPLADQSISFSENVLCLFSNVLLVSSILHFPKAPIFKNLKQI